MFKNTYTYWSSPKLKFPKSFCYFLCHVERLIHPTAYNWMLKLNSPLSGRSLRTRRIAVKCCPLRGGMGFRVQRCRTPPSARCALLPPTLCWSHSQVIPSDIILHCIVLYLTSPRQVQIHSMEGSQTQGRGRFGQRGPRHTELCRNNAGVRGISSNWLNMQDI